MEISITILLLTILACPVQLLLCFWMKPLWLRLLPAAALSLLSLYFFTGGLFAVLEESGIGLFYFIFTVFSCCCPAAPAGRSGR